MERRLFLSRLAAAAAGGASLAGSGQTAFAGGAARLSKLGAQLYTVRRELKSDFEGTLSRVAALGYREVEFAGYFGRKPAEVKAALARNNLAAPSAHIPLAALRGGDGLREALEAAHVIGHKYLVVAYLAAEERKTLDDYRRHADLFNEAGERTRREGVTFAYHNHDFEFAPLGGRVPYDLLLELTDPRAVKFEMDIYWTVKGGASPLEYFERHPGRFHLFHVKDMDSGPARGFTEVGRGRIDFKSVFARARRAGARHYFVEQDETPGSPFDSLKVSLDHLRRLTF